jgi:hypothetical protein
MLRPRWTADIPVGTSTPPVETRMRKKENKDKQRFHNSKQKRIKKRQTNSRCVPTALLPYIPHPKSKHSPSRLGPRPQAGHAQAGNTAPPPKRPGPVFWINICHTLLEGCVCVCDASRVPTQGQLDACMYLPGSRTTGPQSLRQHLPRPRRAGAPIASPCCGHRGEDGRKCE